MTDETTIEERQEHWRKQREQEAAVREALLHQLRDKYPSMLESVEALVKAANSIGEDLAVTRLYHLDKDESDE